MRLFVTFMTILMLSNEGSGGSPSSSCSPKTPISALKEILPKLNSGNKSRLQIPCEPSLISKQFKLKNDMELQQISCVQRNSELSQKEFCEIYSKKQNGIEHSSQLAEKSFNIPRQLLVCTALTETGLNAKLNSNADWQGLFQIRPDTLKHIKTLVKENYKGLGESWNSFAHNLKGKPILDRARGKGSNSSMGAASVYFKWLSENLKEIQGRVDYTNPRDIYLLIAGYNASPNDLVYLAQKPHMTINDIDNFFLGRKNKTTPEYVRKVVNCMQKQTGVANYLNFRPGECDDDYFKIRGKSCLQLTCQGGI